MDNLKITIIDGRDRHLAKGSTTPDVILDIVLGELNFGDAHCLDPDALEGLCDALLTLYPNDPVELKLSYSVSNH
mgnify:CR=1 FL=1|jgi:hypothetical protein